MKLDKREGTKIWKHFQRFAEYDDLKDLYNKCIPELAKFEQRIFDFQAENEKVTLMMRRFDEVISSKTNKAAMKDIYEYMETNYMPVKKENELKEKVEVQLKGFTHKIKEQSDMIELVGKSFNQKIAREIKKAASHLQQVNDNIDRGAGSDDGMPSKGILRVLDSKVG